MRRLLAISVILLAGISSALAQTTKVRGRVVDADTGEPIPFAAVMFENTLVGITSDIDGYYNLDTRDLNLTTLVCQLLGYDVVKVPVKPGVFNQVDFNLKLTENRLSGAVVKADNRKVRRLLANIDANRDRNDPDSRPSYSCDIYTKLELDLTHAEEQFRSRNFRQNFGFVFDYMDTSDVSGVPYLPAMISESMVHRFHTSDPLRDKEVIGANRVSGVNPDNNMLSQFTGSMHLKVNFYRPFINGFGVEFPSPIQSGGLLYYDYYIIDSLQVDARKTYLVRYHPRKGISTPAFDGDMLIDCEDFALRRIHARMQHGGNVNWLRDVVFDSEYRRQDDGGWFYGRDELYADFSLVLKDSTKAVSMIGVRQLDYLRPDFTYSGGIGTDGGHVEVEKDSNFKDEAYWDRVRPYQLSQKERDIYEMVERVKDAPLYKTWYDIAYTLITGYWDIGKIGLGPYHKLISFNNAEGLRPQLGIRTTKEFSHIHRPGAYVAYGFKDHRWKWGASYELLFNKKPWNKLTFDYRHDVHQLGKGDNIYTEGNILSSVFGKKDGQRLGMWDNVSLMYEREVTSGFNWTVDAALKRYYASGHVPMGAYSSIATNELHTRLRFSRDETVSRGHFVRKFVHTRFPVLTLDLTGSIPGLRKDDFAYFRPELTLDWMLRMPPAGITKIHLNTGIIAGRVPYPLLYLHPGNGTYIMDKSAFSCMNYFEFASDTWAMLTIDHNFNGFLLGKIPLIRELNLREEVVLKMAYGTLRDENNPSAAGNAAVMPFPEGMRTMGGTPYIEVGAGVSNILRLFRVDCFWRLTHRDVEPEPNLFVVNVGLDFRF